MLLCDKCKNPVEETEKFTLTIDDHSNQEEMFGTHIMRLDLCEVCAGHMQDYVLEFIEANRREGVSQRIQDPSYDLIYRKRRQKPKQKVEKQEE